MSDSSTSFVYKSSGASIFVADSFLCESVPPEIMMDFCLAVEGRVDFLEHLLRVDDIKGSTNPPTAGTCWNETHQINGRQFVKFRKYLTQVEIEKDCLEIKLSLETLEAPSFIPRFHGTHTTKLSKHPQGTLMEFTHAGIPTTWLSKLLCTFCRGWLRRQFQQAMDKETRQSYTAALQRVVQETRYHSGELSPKEKQDIR